MKSMTGYAYNESAKGSITASVEIKGYNSRFLDLSIHLPPWLSSLEQWIREYICSRFARGKVEVNVRIKDEFAPVSVTVNQLAAHIYEKEINKLAKALHLKERAGLDTLLGLEGILEIDTNRDTEKYRAIIEPALVSASDQFEAERVREGRHTADDISANIALLEDSVKTISSYAPEIELTIKQNLKDRFTELLGDRIDENRILAETAVLLMKYTISEEISRLLAHLKEFRLEAERNPAPGKKLDFLSQEINREINTIGSKTTVLEVSRTVVEMKNALENIREQLRNVE